jgi:nanoRNase/pAp phosphatase (c-di-AMP/oligoRNAs hydrolase)
MKNELAFTDYERGFDVARALLDESYIVMLSYEEEFLILNYEFSEHGADRNDVVLMQRDEYEEELDELAESILNDVAKDYIKGTLGSVLAPRIAKWKDDISSI